MCRLQRELFQRTEGTFFGLYCLVFFGFMSFWGPFCRLYRTQPRPTGVYRISTGMNRMSAGVNRKSTALNRAQPGYNVSLPGWTVCLPLSTVSLPGCTVTEPASTGLNRGSNLSLPYVNRMSTVCQPYVNHVQPGCTVSLPPSAGVNRRQPVNTAILHFSVPSDLTFFFPV